MILNISEQVATQLSEDCSSLTKTLMYRQVVFFSGKILLEEQTVWFLKHPESGCFKSLLEMILSVVVKRFGLISKEAHVSAP